MKKYFLMFAVMTIALFTGCSKDDEGGDGDTSKFVGSWEAKADYILKNGDWVLEYTYLGNECVWTFTETHLTIKDYWDLLNGQTLPYIYKNNKISIPGMELLDNQVISITDAELVLGNKSIEYTDDGYQTFDMKTNFVKK